MLVISEHEDFALTPSLNYQQVHISYSNNLIKAAVILCNVKRETEI